MPVCVEEQQTHHHLGKWHGFGRVANSERVIFAVFDDTKREGNGLSGNSFSTNLNNRTQSLARSSFVPRRTFHQFIVGDRQLDGIAIAHVEDVRRLTADFETQNGRITVRALSVIDLVEAGDCDGHATMGFSSQTDVLGVGQKQLGKKRAAIKLDLADTFSRIIPEGDIGWSWRITMPLKRLISIGKVLVRFT
jgi:hypothetical protein